ncbi:MULTISPECIES: hypothetical protein [Pseudoalteromonas]|uniref:Uncharacterized protein n=2 Tax=Pseudoalteromonas TaxID=53246 RepID=A0ABZ0MAA2_9GAMM|nr:MULTISPECIES: hypothetical protein [Pseudoalteromonas]ATD08437.1 hypothetical protein PPIS_a3693 [Pseudoalteromonas piscicida]AUJ68406.1 hypothetical protein PNC201_00255 [Pseudoalteromonas sp. NC201]MBE0374901.1 hypothetical protein [Pseudoalteromonas flavipulchra NCIMB 2033 = ATCC BAA-314]MBR8843676.1 hypothetical protein [Pseudoalteromonas sp. JC3]MCF2829276.1 hypothetical protein [Pseudoalteromonas sp. OF5H-5]
MLNSAAPCSPSQNTFNQTQPTKQRRINWTKWLAVCGQHLALKDVIMYK